MSTSQTQTENVFGLFYTGDGTRDGSLGGPATNKQVISGDLNNFFAQVTDDLAITGGKKYAVFVLKNISEDKNANKCSFFQELISTSPDLKFKVAISSTGINQDPIDLADADTKPPTEEFLTILGVPTIPNIGLIKPGDFIGIFIEMEVKTGAQEAKAATSLFSAVGQSDPYIPPPEPGPDPCPSGQHRDPVSGLCVPDTTPQPCPAGQHRDSSGNCVPDVCPAGQHRDLAGNCVPNNCQPGFKWDQTANGGLGECVPDDTPVQCPAGQHYDETLQQCVPDHNPQPTMKDITMAAVGDFDCNSRTDSTFQNIRRYVAVRADNDQQLPLGYLIALGDYSYGSTQNCWLDRARVQLEEIYPNNVYPNIGNHDDTEDGSKTKRTAIINAFGIPSSACYTKTIGPIRIIVMDTQSNYDEGSTQHSFAVSSLQAAAADPSIKFIIVSYHKPSIVSASDHGPLNDFRDIYHPLFDQYGVNLVLNGHNHLYHRTLPLRYNSTAPSNPIVVTPNSEGIVTGQAVIYVTAGGGGRTNDDFSGGQEYYIGVRSQEYGILAMRLVENGTRLICQYITNNQELVDNFWFKVLETGTS